MKSLTLPLIVRSPKRVGTGHLQDQISNSGLRRGPSETKTCYNTGFLSSDSQEER